jgi:hypothetical protein
MPKKITLKNPGSPINLPGGRTIGNHNITEEIYEELVAIAPAHADLFDVSEAKEPAPKPLKKDQE